REPDPALRRLCRHAHSHPSPSSERGIKAKLQRVRRLCQLIACAPKPPNPPARKRVRRLRPTNTPTALRCERRDPRGLDHSPYYATGTSNRLFSGNARANAYITSQKTEFAVRLNDWVDGVRSWTARSRCSVIRA